MLENFTCWLVLTRDVHPSTQIVKYQLDLEIIPRTTCKVQISDTRCSNASIVFSTIVAHLPQMTLSNPLLNHLVLRKSVDVDVHLQTYHTVRSMAEDCCWCVFHRLWNSPQLQSQAR
jgi:hypothetical protein